jgi:hypothetical protein
MHDRFPNQSGRVRVGYGLVASHKAEETGH